MLLLLLVVFGGLIVGLVANRFLRQLVVKDDSDGPSPQVLLTPVTTFAALFIAIVLSGSSTTYNTARNVVAQEANVVDNMFEATAYVKQQRFRKGLQASLVCYARAVRGPGWDAMASGASSPALAKVASNWTGTGPHGLRLKFQRMGTDHPDFGTLTSLDRQRGDTRRERLALAQPSVPTVISTFMLILVALTVVALAFFIPRVDNGAHRVALVVAGAVLVCSLGLIRSLDRPYGGLLKIEPTAMTITAQDISADFADDYGTKALPCNARGVPLDES
jgi:hypothetical protein